MNAIKLTIATTPSVDEAIQESDRPEEWPPIPDLFAERLDILIEAEEAGNWHIIRDGFYRRGRWMVEMAVSQKNVVALQTLAALRDGLLAATEYELVHGEGSLRKMDHPQNIFLADIWRRLKKNHPSVFKSVFPPPVHKEMMMADWETFDFSDAMRKISSLCEDR